MFLPILVVLMLFTSSGLAAEIPLYVGTYTGGPSEGIYATTLDTADGQLGPVKLAVETDNPSFLTQSPNGRFVYWAMEDGEPKVGAARREADGTLEFLNAVPSGGAAPCHVSLDAKGRHVFVANYMGGSAAVFRIEADGSIGERTDFVQFEGTGPNPKRQEAPHGHGVSVDPSNRFVYVCDLGTDKVWSFAFDESKGTLTPTDPPAGMVPAGAGSRHLAIHPTLPVAYSANEMGLSVTAFRRDAETGVLTPFQTLPTADEPMEGASLAEIELHPSGRWLYVSSRGDDRIVVFAVEADGSLDRVESVAAGVKIPRNFSIEPEGRWLIAAGQEDNRLAVHAIDPETGKLTPTGHSAEVPTPVSVLFQSLTKQPQ